MARVRPLVLLLLAVGTRAFAQADLPVQPDQRCEEGACTITYESVFFSRYAPFTALDMVNNLPGFALDDGDGDTRGFGGAAGNVIINGARVSAKSESPSDILGRIPASDVLRIEVIRGQVGGLDLRGQSVVANVIRIGDSASGAWTGGAAVYQPDEELYPFANVNYSTRLGGAQITTALEAERYQRLFERRERVLDDAGEVGELRDEEWRESGNRYGATLNASADRRGTRYSLNLGLSYFDESGGETSFRSPIDDETFLLFQGDIDRALESEIGFDAERPLSETWRAKLIGLYRDRDFAEDNWLVRGPPDGPGTTEVVTRFESFSSEMIGRLELDYSGFAGHTVEGNVELSSNRLESDFEFNALENGLLTPQPVPGANSEVEERRLDLLLSDAFRYRELSFDAALGAEASQITQSGGFSEDRSFFFWKPSLAISYAASERTQWRFRALRNVGQLDFGDFVSAADLGDAELALGNPNLSPETTRTVDLSYEARGGDFGIATVTVFHDWIDDVNDLLPLSGMLEVPGNIGSATRSGLRAEATVPLDGIGLRGGRLDAEGEWQRSRVDDPLTGSPRALSDERGWQVDVSLRQDLQAERLAWGARVFYQDVFPLFGLDEIDRLGQRSDIDLFLETRAIAGLRIRLNIEDVLRDGDSRDRRVFAGDRSIAPLAFREVREQRFARTISLEISGDF